MLPKDPYSPRKPDKRLVSTSSNKDKPAFIGRREAMIVLMITFALAVILFSFEGPEGEANNGAPFVLTDMPYPDLEQLPASISTERIALFEERAQEYLGTPERIFGQPLEIMIEWSRRQMEQDAKRAPLPLRLTPIDLSRTSFDSNFFIPGGTQVVVTGQVVEKRPFSVLAKDGEIVEQWQRLLIESAPSIFVQVFARGDSAGLPLGSQVNVVGRYWGVRKAPVSLPDNPDSERPEAKPLALDVSIPTLASFKGTVVQQDQENGVVSLLGLGQSDQPGTTAFRLDPTAFEEVDDNGLRLERRPYYYALGLVSRDRSDPEAYAGDVVDAIDQSQILHHEAPDYRGSVVKVSGRVLRAWEDYDVLIDKPYGVLRVIRMWIWNFVPERRTIQVDGEEQEITSTQYDVYELAVAVTDDRPLPNPKDYVTATGRFLKIQRYRIIDDYLYNRGSLANPDAALSDSSYFKFIIANDFVSDAHQETTIGTVLKVFFLVVFASFLAFMVRLIDKDRQRMDSYKRPVRKLRQSRKALHKKQREAMTAQSERDANDNDVSDDQPPSQSDETLESVDEPDDEGNTVKDRQDEDGDNIKQGDGTAS